MDNKTTQADVRRLRFGDVEVDMERKCVRRQGIPKQLAENYWKALVLLVQRKGDIVTKQELISVLGHVAEGTLTKAIERIRDALGDTTEPRRFIKNQHSMGYRWVAVDALSSEVPLERRSIQRLHMTGHIWPAQGSDLDSAWVTWPTATQGPLSVRPEPQGTLWGANVAMGPGIYIASRGEFIPWTDDLIKEIKTKLLNQCGRHLPPDCGLALRDYRGREDWLTLITGPDGAKRGEIWFGTDPDNDWKYDGLVRVGDDTYVVWQVFQRYSDGSYRRIRMQPPRSTIGSAA